MHTHYQWYLIPIHNNEKKQQQHQQTYAGANNGRKDIKNHSLPSILSDQPSEYSYSSVAHSSSWIPLPCSLGRSQLISCMLNSCPHLPPVNKSSRKRRKRNKQDCAVKCDYCSLVQHKAARFLSKENMISFSSSPPSSDGAKELDSHDTEDFCEKQKKHAKINTKEENSASMDLRVGGTNTNSVLINGVSFLSLQERQHTDNARSGSDCRGIRVNHDDLLVFQISIPSSPFRNTRIVHIGSNSCADKGEHTEKTEKQTLGTDVTDRDKEKSVGDSSGCVVALCYKIVLVQKQQRQHHQHRHDDGNDNEEEIGKDHLQKRKRRNCSVTKTTTKQQHPQKDEEHNDVTAISPKTSSPTSKMPAPLPVTTRTSSLISRRRLSLLPRERSSNTTNITHTKHSSLRKCTNQNNVKTNQKENDEAISPVVLQSYDGSISIASLHKSELSNCNDNDKNQYCKESCNSDEKGGEITSSRTQQESVQTGKKADKATTKSNEKTNVCINTEPNKEENQEEEEYDEEESPLLSMHHFSHYSEQQQQSLLLRDGGDTQDGTLFSCLTNNAQHDSSFSPPTPSTTDNNIVSIPITSFSIQELKRWRDREREKQQDISSSLSLSSSSPSSPPSKPLSFQHALLSIAIFAASSSSAAVATTSAQQSTNNNGNLYDDIEKRNDKNILCTKIAQRALPSLLHGTAVYTAPPYPKSGD